MKTNPSSQDNTRRSAIGAILLAAGSSSRLGQPKQLLPFNGIPLVRHVATQALGSRLAGLTVVIGHEADAVREALNGLSLTIVENPSYKSGQSTSLKAGLLNITRQLRAVLVLLVDQPFVDTALIDQIIALYEETGAPIVAPQYQGRRGNPVLFDASLLPELMTVSGDAGARDIIVRHRDRLVSLPLSDDRYFQDIDTWEDYQSMTNR